ncbi:MAG: M48 family metalloprotease [Cyclobacteriaceae bacterium]
MNSKLYPKSPEIDDYDFIKPSSGFRNSVSRVILSIVIFFLFYLVLIAIATVLMVLALWAGITIIAARPGFITLAAGAGIIALGIMLFIFLFKFIFSKTRNENTFRVEIKENEHPELFTFIRNLNKDTQTKFPKKIFISPEVNAMVFYNSSFWSLFFPVKKNLEIGLGLVNSLNVSEFKAVLAHEFGHFSQRSMKAGSYIYTVNKVIYNLVYEYDNWDTTLSSWAQTGGIFGFFAGITFWLVERIRSLLKVAYNLINISYMRLSREMEYHADLIAVSVSGNMSFRNALRKIEFSSFAYDYTTVYLNSLASGEKATNDIYLNHSFTTSFLAKHNKISVQNGNLSITDEDIENNVVKSRVNIKDQWASHPTLKEREQNISNVNITAEVNEDSAWTIFTNPEILKKVVTRNLYEVGFPNVEFKPLENNEFQDFVHNEINKFKISEDYNGFYENRYLLTFELKELVNSPTPIKFAELYAKENIERIKRLESNKADLEILSQIGLKQIQTKYFEFDNKKYKRRDAQTFITRLKKEIEEEELFVSELDKKSFSYNYQNSKEANKEKELIELYQTHFQVTNSLKSIDELNIKFQNLAHNLYSQPRWTEDEIKQLTAELSALEKQFKDFIKDQDIHSLTEHISFEEQREVLKEYVDSNTFYSKISDFDEQSFINLSNLVHDVSRSMGILYGNSLKKMTDFQLQLKDKLG